MANTQPMTPNFHNLFDCILRERDENGHVKVPLVVKAATYACGHGGCRQPNWSGVLPRDARQAAGRPVPCPRCGYPARLLAVTEQPVKLGPPAWTDPAPAKLCECPDKWALGYRVSGVLVCARPACHGRIG